MINFKKFLLSQRKEKTLQIFFDIETLQFNEDEGYKKPSEFKNVIYSFAFGYFFNDELYVEILPSTKNFIDTIIDTYKHWKKTPKIELIAHNTNKYDNHYLRHDLLYFYKLKNMNLYLKNATKEGNILSTKLTELTTIDKTQSILEKRIKSSNNLELKFFIDGIEFYTTDNFVKTNASIATLGKKLRRLNIIKDEHLKTDFNYTKFNKDYDMSKEEMYKYAYEVYNNLTDDELTYIRNDIIILAYSVKYYSSIFKDFDYSNITFTSNILKYYNDNDITSYQLLKSIGQGKDKIHLKYTDYFFNNENFYDYLKSFYVGGLNFYNDRYVGEIISEKLIAIDINSSYPYSMYKHKVPTFLKDYKEYNEPTIININEFTDDEFTLYRMTKQDFDKYIISKIKSKVYKKMLVKYYSRNDYININTYTLKILKDIMNVELEELKILSYVTFECFYFGSREHISKMYEIKEKGSSNKKLIYKNPFDITVTNDENNEIFSQGEIDNAKVILNGLYGIPALRSHFNIFRWIHSELQNIPNGYENNERNIVFSVFVTSTSLYNLLSPMKDFTPNEVDENFIYCDTDSLYIKKYIENRIDKSLFHNHHLGKWSYDNEEIEKFCVLNHKKYAYYGYNKKTKKKEITIKSGGIPVDSFNTNMTFEKFIETQFSDGVKIKNQKSIYNKQGTISIYDSTTELKEGGGYRVFSFDPFHEELKEKMFEEIRNSGDGSTPDLLYIESNLGNFSMSEVFPVEHETEEKRSLYTLMKFEKQLRKSYLYI